MLYLYTNHLIFWIMRLNLSAPLLALFVLLFPVLTMAQIRQPRFDLLTIEDGLPEDFPTASLQDRLGYIWIGTQNGLVRYDGYDMKIYNSISLRNQSDKQRVSVRDLLKDDDNNLFVGTIMSGLAKYDPVEDKLIRVGHTPKAKGKPINEHVIAFKADKNGIVWIFCADEKNDLHLDRYNPRTLENKSYYFSPEDIKNGANGSLYYEVAQNGTPWLATTTGLYTINKSNYLVKREKLDAGSILGLYEAPSQPGILWLIQTLNKVNYLIRFDPLSGKKSFYPMTEKGYFDILEDKQKRLWIGSANAMLQFDRTTGKFTKYSVKEESDESGNTFFPRISEKKDGVLWTTTTGGGLLRLSVENGTTGLVRYTANSHEKGSLPFDFIQNALIDRSGTEWFGIRGYGLLKLNASRSMLQYITSTPSVNGYPGGSVLSLVLLPQGNFLVSTTRGLFESDKTLTTFKPFSLKDIKSGALNTSAMIVDAKGQTWISTTDAGLIKYNSLTKSSKRYIHDPMDVNTLSSNRIETVLEDRSGKLWVGTADAGICVLDPATGKFKRYPFIRNSGSTIVKDGSLDDVRAISIFEDRSGTIWVGTNFGGLNKLDQATGKFTSIFDPENFFCITSIFEDKKGRLWAGTYLWGLHLVDKIKGTTRQFLKKDGLIFDGVVNINEDKNGNIWVGSAAGFSILNPQTLRVKTFGIQQGLPDLFEKGRYIKTNDDWVFGMKNGILRFNPLDFKPNLIPPQLVIQQLTYSNGNANGTFVKRLNNDKQVELTHDYNKLTFKYAGLHYVNAAKNHYQYQLAGYDKDWIMAGTARSATYTNLAPGTYTFRFKAANSDGIWSKKTAELTVIISPPWWKTWWAYILYIILFAVIIQSYISYRSRALKKHNDQLEKQVSLRTRELSEANEELKTSQEEIITKQGQLIQAEKMASLGELTAGIAHEIQNPLNFVNNFSDLNMELIDEMKEEFEKGDATEALAIASDIKINLEKINHHGKRADSIVKGMLQHSRTGSSTKELTNINSIADEYLRLAYHGLRAKDKSFNAELITNFSPDVPKVRVLAQDIGRVMLNLFTNAFYATHQKQKAGLASYKARVEVSTASIDNFITITVRDNGTGIPESIKEKILQPFFTTKPPGEGTGLGLSLSYDVIKAHGGYFSITSREGEGSEFIIHLPNS